MAEQRPCTNLIPATLVVPLLNEARTLPRLLAAIAAQTRRPAELLFVDGGSSDGSRALIEQWWRQHGWPGARCEAIENPGGLPGGNRNAGVRRSSQPWIAFLDGGIEPASDWFEQLFACAEKSGERAISGICRFNGDGPVARAVCALSSGVGRELRVLPASIFRKEIFDEIGGFRESLRSAEDLEWLQRLESAGIGRKDCPLARVDYRHFPDRCGGALRKWFLYETNTTRAGVRRMQQNGYLAGFAIWLALLAYSPAFGLLSTALYMLARGIADPVRRSRQLLWWRGEPLAFFHAVILGPGLDLAKLAGIIKSFPARFGGHRA